MISGWRTFDIIEVTLGNSGPEVTDKLKAMKFIKNITEKDESLRIYVEDAARSMPVLFDEFKKMGVTTQYLAIHEQTLEDVFIHYTGKTIREAEAQKVSFLIGAGAPRKMPGARI